MMIRQFGHNWSPIFKNATKLYIPSILNADLIFWQPKSWAILLLFRFCGWKYTHSKLIRQFGHNWCLIFKIAAKLYMPYTLKTSGCYTLQIHALEIPWKVVFLKIFLHWYRCMSYSLYDIKKYFPKYNWKYHSSAVLGTVIKRPKGMGNITPQKVVFLTVNIFAVQSKH